MASSSISKITVLYIVFSSTHFDGATYSLIDLIESVRESVHPIVLIPSYGCVYDCFTQKGIECVVCDFAANLCTNPKSIKQWIGYIIRYIPGIITHKTKNKKCVKRLNLLLHNRKIDIVHSNSTVLTIGSDIAANLGCKYVWHLRGFMDLDFGWKPLLGWNDYQKRLTNADAVIGVTETVLRHFLPIDASNGYAIFDAVRSKRDISFIATKTKYFLFCAGWLTSHKGCDFAIKAFAKSQLATKGYKLKIIGRASEIYLARLIHLIKELSLSSYVDINSFSDNIKSEMENATAFLMCSENEGLGRVTVEAMFYGCPVIGRNSGGTKDIISHGKTGFLFNTIEECAQHMIDIAQSDNATIIKSAQEFAIHNFAKEDYGKKIYSVYSTILTQK